MWKKNTPSFECYQYAAVVGKKLTLSVGDDDSYNFIRFTYDEAEQLASSILESVETMRKIECGSEISVTSIP